MKKNLLKFSFVFISCILFGVSIMFIKTGKCESIEGYLYSFTGVSTTSSTSCNATSSNATRTNATSCNATGSNATRTNATSCNATGSNATRTNATSCSATSSNTTKQNVIKTDIKVSNTNNNITQVNKEEIEKIKEETDVDFKYSCSEITDDIIEKISNSNEKQNIIINLDTNTTVRKEIFDAIKGKDKQLTIYSGKNIIVFNGKNIKNTKDIDAKISYSLVSEHSKLKDLKQDGIVLNFANNGELPGPATVKINVTDTIRNNLKMSNIYVYYYDDNTNEMTFLDNIAKYDEKGYIEFIISHNSKYLFLNQKVQEMDGYVTTNTINEETIEDVSFLESYKLYILVVVVSIVLIIIICIIVIISRKKDIE